MRLALPKRMIRTVQRAVIEFDLLEKGDKVLVGLSGGKDSTFLLYALAVLTKHLPFPVGVEAMTIDLGFKRVEEMDWSSLQEICDLLQVPYRIQRVELAEDILHHPDQTPCSQCAYFRRAIIHNYARKHGFNKVAFAHHYDDVVETFLMSILYSGQVTTFLPKTYLERTGVTVIRPLIYLREREIRSFINKLGFTPVPSPCSLDGYTKRAEIKELIRQLQKKNPHTFVHLAAAMREGRPMQFWPRELTKEEIREKSRQFWYGQDR
jgi:tRNA 2-thiocytidine biosynthesis protein TtcA